MPVIQIPIFLRFGIGGCEEYDNATDVTMPREPPNPFANTLEAQFCTTGMPAKVQARRRTPPTATARPPTSVRHTP